MHSRPEEDRIRSLCEGCVKDRWHFCARSPQSPSRRLRWRLTPCSAQRRCRPPRFSGRVASAPRHCQRGGGISTMQVIRRPGRTLGAGPSARASRRVSTSVLTALVAVVAALSMSSSASAALKTVGPIDSQTLFPAWYGDSDGLALQLCQDGPPICLAGPESMEVVHADPDADAEAFYFQAEA